MLSLACLRGLLLHLGERLRWFKEALIPGKGEYSYEEIVSLIEAYINRHEEELQQIQNDTKKYGHRTKASIEDKIVRQQTEEMQEFIGGWGELMYLF